MTTFAEEVDDAFNRLIADKALGYDNDFEIKAKARRTILNLVSERIIGENRPEHNSQFNPSTPDLAAMAQNRFREKQRTTLYEGTKEKTNDK